MLWIIFISLLLLVLPQSGPPAINDPCFHPEYVETKEYSKLYDSPCVSDRKPQGAPAFFQHTGIGNFQQCQDVVRTLFNSSQCKYSQCSLNGVYQPPLQGFFGVRRLWRQAQICQCGNGQTTRKCSSSASFGWQLVLNSPVKFLGKLEDFIEQCLGLEDAKQPQTTVDIHSFTTLWLLLFLTEMLAFTQDFYQSLANMLKYGVTWKNLKFLKKMNWLK